ncbi:hypothetical protein Hanom_Chr01g00040451 [Helianthus anomalus]
MKSGEVIFEVEFLLVVRSMVIPVEREVNGVLTCFNGIGFVLN